MKQTPCKTCSNYISYSLHPPCAYCNVNNNWEQYESIEEANRRKEEFDSIISKRFNKELEVKFLQNEKAWMIFIDGKGIIGWIWPSEDGSYSLKPRSNFSYSTDVLKEITNFLHDVNMTPEQKMIKEMLK